MSQKTWGGRFSGDTDNRVEAFTESIRIDRRLYRHDVIASQAHARMLAEVGLLSSDEASAIVAALDAIAADIERGDFTFSIQLEDIHTHIERALIERLGDVGRKLHTGRSRNDQVVTDVKLWVRDALDALDSRLRELQSALLDAAERNRDLVLPGYTHMQRAQPVLLAHHLLMGESALLVDAGTPELARQDLVPWLAAVLGDPARRAAYDQALARERPPPSASRPSSWDRWASSSNRERFGSTHTTSSSTPRPHPGLGWTTAPSSTRTGPRRSCHTTTRALEPASRSSGTTSRSRTTCRPGPW